MTSSKWAKFKYANSSNLPIYNSGKVDETNDLVITLESDWSREANEGKVTIDGVPLIVFAHKYNNFEVTDDVVRFFKKEILRDFSGNVDDAISYLNKIFHQQALMYPVSNTLQKELGESELGAISPKHLEKAINIERTKNGFKIQERAILESISIFGGPLERFANKNETGQSLLSSNKEHHPLIQLEGVIDIDFSSNPTNPTISIESNQININHAELSSHLDSRSFFQKLVDFLKSITYSNNVEDRSSKFIVPGGCGLDEENEELETSAPSM